MADASLKARQSSLLEILVVQALALWAEGNDPAALASLVQALELAAPEGYVRRFVDEGPAMHDMLERVERGAASKAPGYVSLLLASFERKESQKGLPPPFRQRTPLAGSGSPFHQCLPRPPPLAPYFTNLLLRGSERCCV